MPKKKAFGWKRLSRSCAKRMCCGCPFGRFAFGGLAASYRYSLRINLVWPLCWLPPRQLV